MNLDPVADAPTRAERAWQVLATVLDPEVPAVSVRDLGIVRDVIEPTATAERGEGEPASLGRARKSMNRR